MSVLVEGEKRPARLEYPAASKWLHWATAIVIFGQVPLGFLLEHLPEGRIQNLGYDVHRSFGFVILCLALLRLIVRWAFGAPEPYAGLTPFERRASFFVHRALYVLLVATPLLGWAATSAYPATISVFWLFTLPPLAPESEWLSKILFAAHGAAAICLVALLVPHIGGALMHRVVKRDGVLDRMLPRRKT
jgi:cytochrome b561